MFKKFTREDVQSRANIKSSAQRALRARLVEQFPALEDHIDDIIPKKTQLTHIKCANRISLYAVGSEVVVAQSFDDDLVPSLRIVHKYPQCFPRVQVDRGAIKFVLGGANIMCPGLTSKGAELPEESIDQGKFVAIYAEGKTHALAFGELAMSTAEIQSVNKGVGITLLHYLGDGLWHLGEVN